MAILQYPGLDQVEGEGTKDALRLIWDQLRELDERAEVTDGLSAAELAQARTYLQKGGDGSLDVSGLSGVLRSIQTSRTQQYGMWRMLDTEVGAGFFSFPHTVYNSAPGLWRWTGSNEELRFNVAGVYLVIARLAIFGHASGVLVWGYKNSRAALVSVTSFYRNDASQTVADVYTGILIDIVVAVPGDYMVWESFFGDRSGGSVGSSVIVIRLR